MGRLHGSKRLLDLLALTVIAAGGGLLLFWGLGAKYLWQDEAATAVLSQRMLQTGRPLAYDGLNLITLDQRRAEDRTNMAQLTGSAEAAVSYYTRRGDFKPDTTWKWQPWGQFVVAAAGLECLGHTTLAVRLPFALAAIGTLLGLYGLARRCFGGPMIGLAAVVLLLANACWILHSRQCRYYSLSSLFLVLTVFAFARWRCGARWGAACFIIAAWCWFQVDFGTVWPVLGILFLEALTAHWRKPWRTLSVGLLLAACIAPFFWYYGLWGRLVSGEGTWGSRFWKNLFNVNEYVAPILVVFAAAFLAAWRKDLPPAERLWVLVGCAILVVSPFWVAWTAPTAFVRYTIIEAPVGAVIAAWLLVRGLECVVHSPGRRIQLAWAGVVVLAITPWLSLPVRAAIPLPPGIMRGAVIRPELPRLFQQIFGSLPDPNRIVVEWLRQNAAPTDEILINYEDAPLIFYLPNPIRGGVTAFRVEDDQKGAPAFIVLRRSVGFVYWPAYAREFQKYKWRQVPLNAPDVRWGNNPDPRALAEDPTTAPPLLLARRIKQ